MLSLIRLFRLFCSTTYSIFVAAWYSGYVVLGFVSNAFRDRRLQTNDSEGLRISSAPTSETGLPIAINNLNTMSNVEIVHVRRYYPPGVSEIVGRGSESFIGVLDESTVLKYPCVPGNNESIQTEARLLEVIGSHPRIVATAGLTKYGLVLQRASNGCLKDYISSQPTISMDRKLLWCKQVAEAITFIHGKHVIHCDLNLRNLLLDENLDLLLADFQGMLKSVDGNTILDGLSRECSKSYMPRPHGDYACVKTDIFALGSAIYFIMVGHEVFPELDSLEDDEEILHRFQNGVFPTDDHACYEITEKCWKQQYRSANEVVSDISKIQASKTTTKEH